MKVLHGYYPYNTYSGDVLIEGKKVEMKTTVDSRNAGIAMIYQEINVLASLSVAENIFASKMPTNKFGLVDFKKMYKDAVKYLDMINIKIDAKERLGKLNTSQQQLIMFAKALAENAKVIILDEPTSALTIKETEILMEKLRELKQRGITCIYITHKLDEILKIADKCTVIRDGENIVTLQKGKFDMNTIISAMVGRNVEQIYPDRKASFGKEVFRVENLVVQHKVIKSRNIVDGVSFNLRKGEILGLAGLVGSGRSETLNAIFGSLKSVSGDVYIEENKVRINNTVDAAKNGMALLTEDRHVSGLFLLDKDIKQNSTAAILRKIKKSLMLDFKAEKKIADNLMDQLSIKATSRDTKITSLSGGNQQKVCLAKCLALSPKILLLDEPTRGIDIGAKIDVYKLMYDLSLKGISMIVVSSELPELINICDRFVVIADGKVKGVIDKSEVTENKIMEYAIS